MSSPSLSVPAAHLLAAFASSSYVLSLYLSKQGRLSFLRTSTHSPEAKRWKGRDDPDVIRARLIAISISTLLSCIGVGVLLWTLDGRTGQILSNTLTTLGLNAPSPKLLLASLVTPALFLGPLYAQYLSEGLPLQRLWSIKHDVVPVFTTLQGLRNYVVAPISEEVVFRACVIAIYHLSGASRTKMIFWSPLWFGLAHLHHAYDTYNRMGRTTTALQQAILGTLFQLIYTTLFGIHCSYLFLRSSSLYPSILAHVFCNLMGVPQLGAEVRKFPTKKTHIISAYILGIILYVYTMRAWTKVDGGMYWSFIGH
ncbi:hypothetical protein JAAARDRAFT_56792 [Jaapia argillacea MUCL 33604]|uniref:intramembrane prenyl-peptidase Rce1 n=1 Tax=Jaapia argillacea MUCL 33604 TaxID=933084 RepID=A0A067PYP3_9AGAM|nr:hypothetical protein JAAARDRAFT_56792 [Jaapia argillacea MUCL 33604]